MNSRNYMLRAKDVAEELKSEGYITIAGKIPKTYWVKKMYGYGCHH